MDIHEILRLLPHRQPFLLVDKVLRYEPHKSIVAIKNVTYNEPFFAGHFPEKPVMPGVLMLEALAQAAGVLAYLSAGKTAKDGLLFYFAGIDNARFKRIVGPGDQLQLSVETVKAKQGIYKFNAVATVDGEIACTAELLCAGREG